MFAQKDCKLEKTAHVSGLYTCQGLQHLLRLNNLYTSSMIASMLAPSIHCCMTLEEVNVVCGCNSKAITI